MKRRKYLSPYRIMWLFVMFDLRQAGADGMGRQLNTWE